MCPPTARAALVCLILACPAARAQIIAYDGFDYPPGQNLAGQNGGIGFTDPWSGTGPATIAPGSLSTGGLATTGNSVSFGAAEIITSRHQRTLAAPLGADGTTRWLSFVMQRTTGVSAGGGLVIGSPTTQGPAQGLFVGDPTDSEFYGLSQQGGAGTPTASSRVPVTNQALLVVRLLFAPGNDTFDLFVNPPLGGPPPATPDASISFDLGTGNRLVELSVTSIGAGAAAYLADELRIGNTFSDVTPVPEPSALLLAGATAGGLFAGRRSAAGRRGLRRPGGISATARDPAHFAM